MELEEPEKLSLTNATPSLSFCIASYNESFNLANIISKLEGLCSSHDNQNEIIVDISGSFDNSRELLLEFPFDENKLKIIDRGKRDGLARSMDRLIKRASGDIVVRLDADIDFDSKMIDALVMRLEDQDVGIVSPMLVPTEIDNPFLNILASVQYKIHHHVSLLSPKTTVVQAFRKVPMDLVGKMPEDCVIQDYVTAEGYMAAYEPEAEVHIEPPRFLSDYIRQRIRYISTGNQYSREFNKTASTRSIRTVLKAIKNGIHRKEISPVSLLLFSAFEIIAEFYVVLSHLTKRKEDFTVWKPISKTQRKPRLNKNH